MAAALLVQPGERVLVCGGPGVVEALEGRGADAVVNDGRDPWLRRSGRRACTGTSTTTACGGVGDAVRRGARLIGTNADATYPTPDGPIPGGGSILAAIATAAGVEPVIAGKPHRPMAELIARLASTPSGFDPSSSP